MTIGASAGGLPAIRYGVDLGADVAVSLAGHSLAGNSLNEGLIDMWSDLIDARLNQMGLWDMSDLRAFLTSREYATHIHVFFGEDMMVDANHARLIGDLPNVELHPLKGLDNHQVLEFMVETSDFEQVLRNLMRL